jgi:hypothetical protein
MVIQGNNGTVLQVRIRDKRAFVDLTDATVKLVIRCGNRKFIKDAAVTGLGQVELALSSADLSTAGSYAVYAICNFKDGTSFSSTLDKFEVAGRY